VTQAEAGLVVVGSGITGALVARELLAAGRELTMLERGGLKPHAEQLRDRSWSTGAAGASPTHEPAPGSREYPWNYVFGVGGSSLHWTGVTPRFVAADFRMRSEYGVMRDWPIGLDELLPYYRRAEAALGVAGAPDGPRGRPPMPPHPFSPVDELLRGPLAPWEPLPQARPTRPVGDRPACCASATCELCPVDSRFSVLNGLGDVLDDPRLRLRTETVVERLELDGRRRRVIGLRCVQGGGEPLRLQADTVVLAAGGFENAALLLRSGLERRDVGRYLFDHAHRTLLVRLGRDSGSGRGASLATGASAAFRDGPFRSTRGAAYVSPFNPGLPVAAVLAESLIAGHRGADARRRTLDAHRRTIVLDVLLEDVPQEARRLTLSPSRDALGLPRTRIDYPGPTAYERAGWRAVREEIERRLRPLGVQHVAERPGPAGSHLLGTCRFGDGDDGVVDADQRHLDVDNLYVAGGSSFPTYSPAHPTLTIAALAIRLGEHLRSAA
jgi:choline dehydrogenase-like flavoprotein